MPRRHIGPDSAPREVARWGRRAAESVTPVGVTVSRPRGHTALQGMRRLRPRCGYVSSIAEAVPWDTLTRTGGRENSHTPGRSSRVNCALDLVRLPCIPRTE